MIGSTVSHFRILRRIGAGGMGVVFKAEDLRVPGRVVALKILNAELVADENLKKRFLIEARAASSLDHPNICQIGEVDETDEGRPFMTMTFYGGPSLRHMLSEAPLDPFTSLQIAYSLAQGLSCAHRRGIIHRDIKPGNVMINDEGYVKIVDFGLARLAGETRITHSDMTLGTVAYMSPQQANGQDVDGRTDIWSLGIVLFEMLTGKLPFRGTIDQAMVYSILNEDHQTAREANPKVSKEVSKIVDRCLEKDVDKRYQTADSLIEDLLDVARDMGWESSIAGATVAPISWTQKRQRVIRYRTAAVIALAVIVAGFAGYKLWRRGEPSPYVTDMRLAVLPIESKLGPDYNAYGMGLASIVSDMLEDAAERHGSMWVVPGKFVAYADPVGAPEARDAFGVNYVMAGDIQRYTDKKRVTLRLLDDSGEELRNAVVDFAGDTPSPGEMTAELFQLVGIDNADPGEYDAYFPADDTNARDYTSAIGLLLENPDSAAVLLESVREAMPDFGPGRTALGQTYFELYTNTYEESYWERSLEELKAGRSMSPSDPRAHFQLGYIYRLSQEPDSAIACFKAALRLAPNYHLAVRGLARTYRAQSRLDEAKQVLETAANERKDFFSDHRSLGFFFYRVDEYEEAIHWLNRTVELAPADVSTLNALGATHHVIGQWAKAREMFDRSFQISPNCDNCNNVGLMYYYETRYWDSAKYYETALSYCDSTDHRAWGNWAAALYWVDGKRDEAISRYKKAIDLANRDLSNDPDDAELISSLIDYYSMSHMIEDALRLIEKGLPFARNDPDMSFRIGGAYEMAGDRNSALHHIGEAIRHDYPIEIVERTPTLRDLRLDARYQQMVAEKKQAANE